MQKALLELDHVCKYYTGAQSVVIGLDHVDLQFNAGEFVAVTGESGSGKSTLAQVICGILPYESGEMRSEGKTTSHYDGSDWERYRRDKISYISQNYGILLGSTVLSNVVSALRITGMEKDSAKKRAEELLKLVELWDLRGRRAAKLSSGQKQRLSIARALAKPAPILVADEPTGNLDKENSEKVIRLLARAARERLVILITHDFQEAEGYATRRIGLQDGRVVLDAPLAPRAETAPMAPPEVEKRALSPYISGVQITGRPVWSVMAGLFFALTAYAVFAFLGTFIVNLDDTATRIYDDSAFTNGDKTRIVVQRSDLEPMTEADYEKILSVRYARTLERSGYLADWSYAWRFGVDYEVHVNVENRGNDDNRYKIINKSVEVKPDSMAFVQTVPLLADGREFLTRGRLPENMYEVVAADAPELLGTTVDVYLHNEKEWGTGSYVHIEAEVVGITDYGTGLYFADELGRVVQNYIAGGGIENGMYLVAPVSGKVNTIDANIVANDFLTSGRLPEKVGEVVLRGSEELLGTELPGIHAKVVGTSAFGVILDNEETVKAEVLEDERLTDEERTALESVIEDVLFRIRGEEGHSKLADLYLYGSDTCAIAESLYEQRQKLAERYDSYQAVGLYDLSDPETDFTNQDNRVVMRAVGYHDSTFQWYVNVTPEVFDAIAWQGNSNQVSLYIEDYAYTDRVLEEVQDLGYLAISVFRQGATAKNQTLAAERMQTLTVCLAALAAVVLLQILVLRELFGIQLESYKLLADMGLGCAAAQRSVLWQVLLFAMGGQLLGFGGILACGAMGIERIQSILRYLPPGNWLILSCAHLAVSVLAGVWVMKRIQRKVYPKSGEKGDLDLNCGEAAV